jgi:hypothetical protein
MLKGSDDQVKSIGECMRRLQCIIKKHLLQRHVDRSAQFVTECLQILPIALDEQQAGGAGFVRTVDRSDQMIEDMTAAEPQPVSITDQIPRPPIPAIAVVDAAIPHKRTPTTSHDNQAVLLKPTIGPGGSVLVDAVAFGKVADCRQTIACGILTGLDLLLK